MATPQPNATLSQTTKEKLVEIARQAGIIYLGIFGSVARGDAQPGSDVDIAVRFGRPITLFDLVGVKLDMESALGQAVDLIPIDSAYPFIRDTMAKDLVVLYEDDTQSPGSSDGA